MSRARIRHRLQVLRSRDGLWFYHRRCNGHVCEASETYTRRATATRQARRLAADLRSSVVEVHDTAGKLEKTYPGLGA